MEVRKVIMVGNAFAVCLPKKMLRVLRASGGDYLELHLADMNTLVIRKHKMSERRIYNGREQQPSTEYPGKDKV